MDYYYVVKVGGDGRERRVMSRHRKKDCAQKARDLLRCQSGIEGLRIVYRGPESERPVSSSGKTKIIQETKIEQASAILKNGIYLSESGLIQRLRVQLMKLSSDDLTDLQTIIDIKMKEARQGTGEGPENS